MTSLFHQIDMPPTLNHFWKRSKRGMFLSKEYETWIRTATIQIGKVCVIECASDWHIEIDFFFHYVKKPRRVDLDNRIKPVLDVLSKIYGVEDSLITKITARKKLIKEAKGIDYCYIKSDLFTGIPARAAS